MYSKTFAILMLLGSCSGDNLQITSNGTTSVAKAHLKYTSLSQNPNGLVATGAEVSDEATDLEEKDVSCLEWTWILPIITIASVVVLILWLPIWWRNLGHLQELHIYFAACVMGLVSLIPTVVAGLLALFGDRDLWAAWHACFWISLSCVLFSTLNLSELDESIKGISCFWVVVMVITKCIMVVYIFVQFLVDHLLLGIGLKVFAVLFSVEFVLWIISIICTAGFRIRQEAADKAAADKAAADKAAADKAAAAAKRK